MATRITALFVAVLVLVLNMVSSGQKAFGNSQPPASEPETIKRQPIFYVFLITAKWNSESRSCQSAVKRAVESFPGVVRLINAGFDDPRNEEFVQAIGVNEVPTAIVVDKSGQRVKTLIGAAECLSLKTILGALIPSEDVAVEQASAQANLGG